MGRIVLGSVVLAVGITYTAVAFTYKAIDRAIDGAFS